MDPGLLIKTDVLGGLTGILGEGAHSGLGRLRNHLLLFSGNVIYSIGLDRGDSTGNKRAIFRMLKCTKYTDFNGKFKQVRLDATS